MKFRPLEPWYKRYAKDERWEEIKRLVKMCRFGEANYILCELNKDWGLPYK